MSPASAFGGWREGVPVRPIAWLPRAETWLARIGWTRAGGLLSVREAPA